LAAFAFKKYFSGTFDVSITPDNVDSLARLGDSEVFAVEHTPAARIPETGQRPDDGGKISSSMGAKETCNVFE
jgi:hypothetical protein